VKLFKHLQLLSLLQVFIYMRERGIVRFEDHAPLNVFGFSSVHVLPGRLGDWYECMLNLAGVISKRGCKAVPTSCLYEIFKICGMEVINKGKHTTSAKKSLEQGEFIFSEECFATNKERLVHGRKGKTQENNSTPKVCTM